jgi:transposase
MRYITGLTAEEKATLEEGCRNHQKHHFRNRRRSVMMSDDGFSVPEIARFFDTRTRTVYTWFTRWESSGITGLMILPGRGRRAVLNGCSEEQFLTAEEEVLENPRNLRKVSEKLSCEFGFKITKKMLRRFIKKSSVTHGNASEES